MRIFEFTDKLLHIAEKEAKKIGKLKRSITGGDGNVAGVIGEYAARRVYGGRRENTYHYDLVRDNGETDDVKTKRITTDVIQPHYDCSIYEEGKFQKCDSYIFVRVNMESRLVFVLGSLPKDEYFRIAEFCKKGDVDPKSDFGWIYKHNCYNVEIGDLIPPPKRKI